MTKRKAISTKTRFEIFKRDSFTCQYCGKTPPRVILEVDHIVPVVSGGKNNIDNLITACFDCNRGKAGNELTQIIESVADKHKRIKEKEKQYLEFRKLQDSIENRINQELQVISAEFSKFFPKHQMSDNFINTSVRRFIDSLGFPVVLSILRMSMSVTGSAYGSTQYFCKVCWNKIKEDEE